MTEYPVQCYNNNGETYGRYVTLVNNESCHDYKERYGIDGFVCRDSDDCFCKFAEANTFPFPSGTIGKTYERDEVEVATQYYKYGTVSNYWTDEVLTGAYKKGERQIFRIIPQPVEKEPETVEQAAKDYAFKHTLDSGLDRKVRNARIAAFKEGAEWQKKQEASR